MLLILAVLAAAPAAAQLGGGNDDDAALVSHTMPNYLECGSTGTVEITLRNTGDTTWQDAYALTALEDPDPFAGSASFAIPAYQRVPPGNALTFTLPFTAPTQVARYTTRWQMTHQGTAFGTVVEKHIYAACQTGETDAAELVAHTLPATLACDAVASVEVTMRNTGTSVWRREHWYRLGTVGGSDPFREAKRVVLPEGIEIRPGASHTFGFDLTAPAEPGDYLTDWRMVHDAVRWFGDKAERTVRVECSDYGVTVEAPHAQALAHTETFDWGTAHEATLPADFAFAVTGPTDGSIDDLRIVSSEGPLELSLDASSGLHQLTDGVLQVAGVLAPAAGVVLDLLDVETPFRFALAFDHSQGGTFQFEVVGVLRKRSTADPSNIDVRWIGFDGTFDEAIAEADLPRTFRFTARVDNNDPSGTIVVLRDLIDIELNQKPFGVDVDVETFGPAEIELAPHESYSFDVLVTASAIAETGDLGAQVDIPIELEPGSEYLTILPLNGHIEILSPDVDLSGISVISGTGAIVGHLGSFEIAPVEGDSELGFSIENHNNSQVEVGDYSVGYSGPGAGGIEYLLDHPSNSVGPDQILSVSGPLNVLETAVPGDFTLRVRFRVTAGAFPPDFDEEFIFDIHGTLVACGGASSCPPLIQLRDDRGLVVRGTYSRRPVAGTVQELELRAFNLGDEDLEMDGVTVNGDPRFSILSQPTPDTVDGNPESFSAFKLAFDATDVDLDATYQANVVVDSNSITNAPLQFTIRMEPQPELPIRIEILGHTIAENHVDLGTSSKLPFERKLLITNLTDDDVYVKSFQALRSRGGPLAWTWRDPQPPTGASTSNARRLDAGETYSLDFYLHLNGQPGDVNKPYTFNLGFDYKENQPGPYDTYDVAVTGSFRDIYGVPDIPAPDPMCETPENQNMCDQAYCDELFRIEAEAEGQFALCLAGGTTAYFGCVRCGPVVPCWVVCAIGTATVNLGCHLANADVQEDLYEAVTEYQSCYCNELNQTQYCEETYFVGYDILNLPVGSSVDVTARCITQSSDDIVATEAVRLSNAQHFDLVACPVGSGLNVSTSEVTGGVDEPFRCRLAEPQPGDDPGLPQYNRNLDSHFSAVFDCGCPTAESCGDQYTLTGTAFGLRPIGDEIEVVVNLEGNFSPFAVTTTVTENGHFSFPVQVPESESYSVALTNKLDYPHCDVEPTGNPISGQGGLVEIMRLVCDESRPNVRIIDPLHGDTAVPDGTGAVTIRATAGDAVGVDHVDFFVSGSLLGRDHIPPYEIRWYPNSFGAYRLEAEATNIHNISTRSVPVDVNVAGSLTCEDDTSQPLINFVYPGENAVVTLDPGGTELTLSAEVTDDTGVLRVDFILDGERITLLGDGPFFTETVTSIGEGEHTLRVEAVDDCNKVASIPPEPGAAYSFHVAGTASGAILGANCDVIFGWADDLDHEDPLRVELYQGGPRGVGTLIAAEYANQNCGTGTNNCFSLLTPLDLFTGLPESIYGHARDLDENGIPTGEWPPLALSGVTVNCDGSGGGGGGGGIPLPPQGLNATQGTFADRVQVSWSAAPDATSYQVYRALSNDVGAAAMIDGNVTATQVDDMSVTAGTTYYYWLKSVNTQGSSVFSDAVSGFAQGTPTNTGGPAGFVDVASCNTIAGWARDPDFTGPIEVHLYKNAPAGSGTLIATVLADGLRTDLPFPDQHHGFGWPVPAGSIPDTTPIYAYGIGVDSLGAPNGENPALNPSPIFFDCPPTGPPPAPTGVNASDGIHTGFVRVTWSPVGGNPTYQVWRSSTSSSGDAEPVSLALGDTSFDDDSVTPGQTYHYFVKASNAQGASPFSAGNAGHASGSTGGGVDPAGSLDAAVCGEVSGWARDPDTTAPIEVRIYRGGPPGSGALIATKLANLPRPDLPFPDKNHGFHYQPSASTIIDTQPVHAYAVDVDAQGNPTGGTVQLSGSPTPFDCPSTGPPPAPEGVQATNGSHNGFVRITWVPGPNNPTYQVWRSITNNSASAEPVSLMISGATTFDDTSVTPGQTYYFWVKASNSFGSSPFSESDNGWAP